MRALLVNPESPVTYWSQNHALPFVRRKAILPPLGLVTVAALLPSDWDIRLIDMCIQPLRREDLDWSDIALVTGMLVQRESLLDVLAQCRRAGVCTVVGGPYATALPDELPNADHIVQGEAEGVMPELLADLEAKKAKRNYSSLGKPDMSLSPTPRYDLLSIGMYHQMALQFSRGCPYTCEFCDIIVMYGRKPRTKTSAQVLLELEAICKTGFCGDIFFVDDNFIGNKKAVKELLTSLARWKDDNGARVSFYTEATVNLANDEPLMKLMVRAGFHAVFMGIETPSVAALRETRKFQNLSDNPIEQIHKIFRSGLDVWGGFIVGFDSDDEGIFRKIVAFIRAAGISYAMVGLLVALPNTELHNRLVAEGRIRRGDQFSGNQFAMTNINTRMPTKALLNGYMSVLTQLYSPKSYFGRCKENIRVQVLRRRARVLARREIFAALVSVIRQGILGSYRGPYWRFIIWTLMRHPRKLGTAISQAAVGHHFMTYTRNTVIPSLQARIRREVEAEARPMHPGVMARPIVRCEAGSNG